MTPERTWHAPPAVAMTSSYVAAATVEEALEAMGAGARPVAGTDLVVGARQGKRTSLPESIVAIHRLDGLRGIEESDGALGREPRDHAEPASHPVACERLTALADASARVGSHATRAHGTIGVANASPAIAGGPLMVFGATVSLRSAAGERRIPVAGARHGTRQDGHRAGRASRRSRSRCRPRERGAPTPGSSTGVMEIAVVGATVAVTVVDGSAQRAQPWRSRRWRPRSDLRRRQRRGRRHGRRRGGGRDCGSAAADAAEPISDVRASADHRRR